SPPRRRRRPGGRFGSSVVPGNVQKEPKWGIALCGLGQGVIFRRVWTALPGALGKKEGHGPIQERKVVTTPVGRRARILRRSLHSLRDPRGWRRVRGLPEPPR